MLQALWANIYGCSKVPYLKADALNFHWSSVARFTSYIFAMNRLFFLCLALFSIQAFGCKCSYPLLTDNYQRSDFVAVVKILKVTPDPKNEAYHTLEIEPIHVYKGKDASLLNVNTFANTSCAFSVPEGSTWLVFAKVGTNAIPGFGPCSGSEQIHRNLNAVRYPAEGYEKDVDLKLAILTYLKENGLVDTNPYDLYLSDLKLFNIIMFSGFEHQNQFAVYELDVNEDLSIGKLTTRQSFDNPQLAESFTAYLRKNARLNPTAHKGIPTKTKLVLIFQYHSTEGKAASFVMRI